jgi:hypothetical protein
VQYLSRSVQRAALQSVVQPGDALVEELMLGVDVAAERRPGRGERPDPELKPSAAELVEDSRAYGSSLPLAAVPLVQPTNDAHQSDPASRYSRLMVVVSADARS